MFNISDFLVRIGMALVMFSVIILMSSILFYKGQLQLSRPISHQWLGTVQSSMTALHHMTIAPVIESGMQAVQSFQHPAAQKIKEKPLFTPPDFIDSDRLAAFQRYHITHAHVHVPR